MDNRDGTLSIFGTLLDAAAPQAAPAPGPATASTADELVSLSRTLSFNDRSGSRSRRRRSSDKRGGRRDRNVELLVRDPR